jgi:hypothetical protein
MGGHGGEGCVHIPWYATGFRADKFEPALAQVAAVAIRYGASEYEVFRSRDDRYKFLQVSYFDDRLDWERYWEGEEFVRFRAIHSSWYQVPVLPVWHDLVAKGHLVTAPQDTPPVHAE